MMKTYQSIDEYIDNFPDETQEKLQEIRRIIREILPEAIEKISYGIPTFWQGKNIVHFAAYPNHIGFYPGSKAIVVFQKDLAGYKTSKGTVQFPLNRPLPIDLIITITKFCREQNIQIEK